MGFASVCWQMFPHKVATNVVKRIGRPAGPCNHLASGRWGTVLYHYAVSAAHLPHAPNAEISTGLQAQHGKRELQVIHDGEGVGLWGVRPGSSNC
jgi:hypothetical protein